MSLIILPGAKKPNEEWAYENGKEVLVWDENPVTKRVVLTSPMTPPRFGFNRHKTNEPKEMDRIFKRLNEQEHEDNEAMVEKLNGWDMRLWTVENPLMVAWQIQLKERGLKTAILSNMGDAVLESVLRAFAWINRFDLCVWSYQLGIAKPDPAIYLYTLDKLGTHPEETLFIDDKRENVWAARALGIQAIEYVSVDQLRRELIASGLEAVLPLPA